MFIDVRASEKSHHKKKTPNTKKILIENWGNVGNKETNIKNVIINKRTRGNKQLNIKKTTWDMKIRKSRKKRGKIILIFEFRYFFQCL